MSTREINEIAWGLISRALSTCEGESRAFTISELASIGCISRRECEHLLENCLERLPFVVVSGTAGYWRPSSADEVEHYLASLRSRLVKLARRRRTIKRLALASGFVHEGGRIAPAPAKQREFLFPSMEGAHHG